MSYEVRLTRSAQRDLEDLPPDVRRRVAGRLRALAADPGPPGVRALAGLPPGSFRVRVGDYRIAYKVDGEARVVTVWEVGHRDKFYEKARRRRDA